MYKCLLCTVVYRRLEADPGPGCVNSFRASVSCLTAVLTSSKPRELAAYFANFWASEIELKAGLKPAVACGMSNAPVSSNDVALKLPFPA